MGAARRKFPPFSLSRLLKTVFAPRQNESICVLIDLKNPKAIKNCSFLKNKKLSVQRYAHDVFYQGLQKKILKEMGLKGGELFAYKITGGSNLDMPDECFDITGRRLSLEKDVYPNYDIILCVSTYSATAPLTAFAKQYKFRGATLHGVNAIILRSGLSVDYNQVSRDAEKLRRGMTKADYVEIDFEVKGERRTLKLELGGQEAQKSHGICREKKPDVANLPAGEIYYVPKSAAGQFPLKQEDGTLAWMEVAKGRIVSGTFLKGSRATLRNYLKKIKGDPAAGELGELGFGTQVLPVSGSDIQDEKILGTLHIATGRSDHLGGQLTPEKFVNKKNATHEDILFAPHKTPEIKVSEVRMKRGRRTEILIRHYQPAAYLKSLLKAK